MDSISEGVGSSQILPLLQRIACEGLNVNLISFEKHPPTNSVISELKKSNIVWNQRSFEKRGYLGGLSRLIEIKSEIANTEIIHARSDIPAVAAVLSKEAPVLWDIRSLWADQRSFMETNQIKKKIISSLRVLESVASSGSAAISTLTSSVVPILEARHKDLPTLQIVVPTAVDLVRFKFVPNLPNSIKGLYSGTYNDYYDLVLSKKFIEQMFKLGPLEVEWARPKESSRISLNAGETASFAATQIEMANIIPNYSFGVSVCKLNAGASLTAAMPTKIGEFLACGRPIVVNKGLGDMDQFIEESRIGVILDGNPSNLKRSAGELIELLNDKDTPSRCRAVAEKYFSMDVGARKYLGIYEEMKISS
jgi:hypothetical protein